MRFSGSSLEGPAPYPLALQSAAGAEQAMSSGSVFQKLVIRRMLTEARRIACLTSCGSRL